VLFAAEVTEEVEELEVEEVDIMEDDDVDEETEEDVGIEEEEETEVVEGVDTILEVDALELEVVVETDVLTDKAA